MSKKEGSGLVRLKIMLHSPPPKDGYYYNGLEFLDQDFFPLCFEAVQNKYWDCFEQINNEPETIFDYLKDAGHSDVGIYELYGTYTETWTPWSDYWNGGTEWDCEWKIEDIKIKKYDDKEMCELLNDKYEMENRFWVLELIQKLKLEKYIVQVRDEYSTYHSYNILNINGDNENEFQILS